MENQLFKNRYRIPSARLPYWDYTKSGFYFVTVKTQRNRPVFGTIVNRHMEHSKSGNVVIDELIKTSAIRQNVILDEWTVMPDHIHVILYIKPHPAVETPWQGVSTMGRFTANNMPNHWSPGALGAIVNQIKRACTIRIRKIYPWFAWQSRYHDRIIRNGDELDAVREYIRNNAIKHSI